MPAGIPVGSWGRAWLASGFPAFWPGTGWLPPPVVLSTAGFFAFFVILWHEYWLVRAAPHEPCQKERGAAMKEPTPWEGFHAAVAGGHEENIRRSFEDLYKHAKDEMVRFATYCVRKHNPDLVPGYVLDARE